MKSRDIETHLRALESRTLRRVDNLAREKSLSAVSDITGMDPSHLSAWRHGNRKLSYKKLLEIAHRLGL